ncbi:MAG: hypothetical protein DIU71_05940 [Proteobacteria bacterium]|nr:MAG: hypothetical protein DIU71_05940 [Pseudomonadota bacterium]
MSQLQTFSTTALPPHRRVDYWNELAGNALTQLVSDPLDRRAFSGHLTRIEVGQISLAELYSDPAVVRHCKHHIAQSHVARFFLCLQLDGVSINRQQGREALLRYGDFTLFDSTRPYEVSFTEPNRMLVVCIPHDELNRRVPNLEAAVALRMPGDNGLCGLLASFLCNFWRQQHTEGDMYLPPRFSDALLDLIASAYAAHMRGWTNESSMAVARREQVRSYIEDHLHDPQLTPGRIAAALHLSSRRLHQLFEADQETVGGYILRRRLEECARAIADASQRGRTVTEIAFRHGFNNASHFGRVFRERYGVTPSEYRLRSLSTS